MSRPDLLALSPQAIASLSNLGLVKRAQKEIEQGKGPRLEEAPDGIVTGTFEDGAVARLVPGKGLKDSPCSCNASGVCRHRVAIALAYPAFTRASSPPQAPAPTEAKPESPWSPGVADDEALAKLLPVRSLERAQALRERGFIAQVRRGTFVGEDVPSVALATCTVRFLVPRDLGYARCDCSTGTGCEHLPLAVWAFRVADERDPQARELSVEVAGAPVSAREGGAALEAACDLAAFLLLEGAQHAAAGLGARFAVARAGVSEARMAWMVAALEDVEDLLSAYHGRGARYSPLRLTMALCEVFARARAARAAGGAQPPRAVLGMDEAPETKLDHLRLVSLGARLSADGRERQVEVLLADPAAASLLVLRRAFSYREDQTPEDGADLGRRQAVPGATLEALARGQVVTSGATRLPNRLVVISSRGLQRTSVTPQSGDWSILPAPLLVTDIAALEATLRARPPRFLRPRLLAENVFAFAVGCVVDVAYAPGAQALRAKLEDPGGRPFFVELAHRVVAPGALDALAEGLAGRPGVVRYLSGSVRRTAHGLVVEPVALACEGSRMVVLDLAPAAASGAVRIAEDAPPLPLIPAALAEIEGCLADAVHQGLRHVVPAWASRVKAAAERARELGVRRLAEDLGAMAAKLDAAQASGRVEDEAALAESWADAALRAAVALEQLGE